MQTRGNDLWRAISGQLAQLPQSVSARTHWLQESVAEASRRWAKAAPAPIVEEPRRLGLVLGGGGGKGGSHLGVLAVLHAHDIPIDLIVGTSIGGAVGVLHAAGLDLAEIAQVFRATALRNIATADPSRTGLIGDRKREALLTRVLGDRTFADLRIPCAVVATDLVSGREVVLNEGPLVPALMATTALPGIFPPVVHGQGLLSDGGILNNVPVDVAEQLGARKVIAVQLVSSGEQFALAAREPDNLLGRLMLAPRQFAIADRALGLLISRTTSLSLEQHPPALLLKPQVGQISTLDMTQLEAGRQAGEAAAEAALDRLLELRAWRNEPPRPPVAPTVRQRVSLPIPGRRAPTAQLVPPRTARTADRDRPGRQ